MRLFYSSLALISYLLMGSTSSAAAQTAPAAASWYVGVAASYHRFAQPETVHTEGTVSPYQLHPVQVVVGHRFARGLGLEVAFMQHQRAAPAYSDRLYPDAGNYSYYSTEDVRAFAASVLLKAPLLHRAPENRWQLDGQLGLSYLMTQYTEKHYYASALNPNPPAPTFEERLSSGDLPITTGLSAQYRLGSHLALTADASIHISWVLCVVRLFGSSSSPIGGGGGLGVRYTL